ncbi:MAG: hypothetical protein ACREEB_11310 [Caulobacteraceae bacterium]
MSSRRAEASLERVADLQQSTIDRLDEDLERQKVAQRPSIVLTIDHPSGKPPIVNITQASTGQLPKWTLASARSLNSDRALLLKADLTDNPLGDKLATLPFNIDFPSQAVRGQPLRFFVVFNAGPWDTVDVEVRLEREDGDSFTQRLTVPAGPAEPWARK